MAETEAKRSTPERDPDAKERARALVHQFDLRAELCAVAYQGVTLF